MRKYLLFILLYIPLILITQAQSLHLHGIVTGKDIDGKTMPLSHAKILAQPVLAGTFTDEEGKFHLMAPEGSERIVIRYKGFQSQTVELDGQEMISIQLEAIRQADSVTITAREKSSGIDPMSTPLIETLDKKELLRAACCNLGESFETNASVDVSFANAITGAKQIQLLGLTGAYTQLTFESMPGIRGLNTNIGLELIPGPWIESIQISKGAGSVVNGYESIAGQINIELIKPQDGPKLYINGFLNQGGRTELNVHTSQKLSDGVSTSLLLHGSRRRAEVDRNEDTFLDIPDKSQVNVLNRWYFSVNESVNAQVGVHAVYDYRQGGQVPNSNPLGDLEFEQVSQMVRAWTKVAWINPNDPVESLGLQIMGSRFQQSFSFLNFGFNDYFTLYNGDQTTFYVNLIYQRNLFNPNHQLRTGLSGVYDRVEEDLDNDLDDQIVDQAFSREERVPGGFVEYTYKLRENFRLIAATRVDYQALFEQWSILPRLHLLYRPNDWTSFRASLGKGQRTANILGENMGYFASNRTINIPTAETNRVYGLPQEIGWNTGFNFIRDFRIAKRPLQFVATYFYTWFEQMAIVDLDQSQLDIVFYALDGPAFSHNLQLNVEYEPVEDLSIRLAYKYQDSRVTYRDGLRQRPFVPLHRGFANIAYRTANDWNFDLTAQYVGRQRLPDVDENAPVSALTESPAYWNLLGQVSKSFGKRWEVYVGGENLLNFQQPNPIVAAADTDSPYFDASRVWGPIFGRNVYAGFRFTVK
ncbi:MAG: TonB-dependent receptor [Bacteroidota bacterium]